MVNRRNSSIDERYGPGESTAPQSGSNENARRARVREEDRTSRLPGRVTEAGARRGLSARLMLCSPRQQRRMSVSRSNQRPRINLRGKGRLASRLRRGPERTEPLERGF